MQPALQRFACTQCGKCCNRSPELLLSEAAALADVFVFRLMFRLYSLPRALAGYVGGAPDREIFYQKKRLLAAYSARERPVRVAQGGKPVEHVRYLVLSALSLDTGGGACSALEAGRCRIYERRPLACRTVPFHYSRTEASAASDLQAFVATPGYGCDTGETAAPVLDRGRIVDPAIRRAREEALEFTGREKSWKDAILRRMKPGGAADAGLPTLDRIEAHATVGAITVPMRAAWKVAADAGLIGADAYRTLIESQLALIERDLAAPACPPDTRATLAEMRTEYRGALDN